MYYNKEHEEKVNNRGDGYIYIGSYKTKEVTIDNKNINGGYIYIRIKCPYCGKEYDIRLNNFYKGNKCTKCCNKYENSFAYYIQQELKEPLNKYWDWKKNTVNPYCISKYNKRKVWIKCIKTNYHGSYETNISHFVEGKRCPYCTGKKIHPKDSFGQWLIDTYGDNVIEKYWSPKNTVNPFEIAPKSNKKVLILCQEKDYHNDEGGYLVTPANFYNGCRCPYCVHKTGKTHPKDSFGQYLIDIYGDNAIKKYWSPKNTMNPFKIAINSNKKVWLLCQDKYYHNDKGGYLITPNNFYNGSRCPYCINRKIHLKDSFGALYPEKAKYWSKNNKKSPYEVTPKTGEKFKFICEKCGKEFERSLEKLNRNDTGVVCISCQSSKLEQNTKEVLDKYNIEYKTQVIYEGLVGLKGGLLSYDFYLPKYNILLECQGIQHEKFTKGLHENKKDFLKQLEHDRRKFEYAIKNNYIPMEIWYWDIDNIEEILIRELGLS